MNWLFFCLILHASGFTYLLTNLNNTQCTKQWYVNTQRSETFVCMHLPAKFWAARNLFITICSSAPSLNYSLSRWPTCTAISCSTIHILLGSAGMLLMGNVPLILQVQTCFRAPCWALPLPTHSQYVFNVPHKEKRRAVCLHSGILELVLIIEPLSIQRQWSQPRCLFHRSLNLCRSPNVHYSSTPTRGV